MIGIEMHNSKQDQLPSVCRFGNVQLDPSKTRVFKNQVSSSTDTAALIQLL